MYFIWKEGYRIRTVKLGSYQTEAAGRQAPHIHFEVLGQFERLVTQMYFPGEALNREDRFFLSTRHPDLIIATLHEANVRSHLGHLKQSLMTWRFPVTFPTSS
jgi:protocatechuate 3,4-dioxygenase beta subunit